MSEILAYLGDLATIILDDSMRVMGLDNFVDVGEDKNSRTFDIC